MPRHAIVQKAMPRHAIERKAMPRHVIVQKAIFAAFCAIFAAVYHWLIQKRDSFYMRNRFFEILGTGSGTGTDLGTGAVESATGKYDKFDGNGKGRCESSWIASP